MMCMCINIRQYAVRTVVCKAHQINFAIQGHSMSNQRGGGGGGGGGGEYDPMASEISSNLVWRRCLWIDSATSNFAFKYSWICGP